MGLRVVVAALRWPLLDSQPNIAALPLYNFPSAWHGKRKNLMESTPGCLLGLLSHLPKRFTTPLPTLACAGKGRAKIKSLFSHLHLCCCRFLAEKMLRHITANMEHLMPGTRNMGMVSSFGPCLRQSELNTLGQACMQATSYISAMPPAPRQHARISASHTHHSIPGRLHLLNIRQG